MHKMRFDVKCVKECLVKNKIVYTVREWEGYSAPRCQVKEWAIQIDFLYYGNMVINER